AQRATSPAYARQVRSSYTPNRFARYATPSGSRRARSARRASTLRTSGFPPEGADQELDVALGDALERGPGLVPDAQRRRVSQAEQRERRHARIQIGAELAGIDPLLDDSLDQPLVALLHRADALARGARQETPLAQEDERVVQPLEHRREVVEHKLRDL